jgi:uncharacterized protein (DUF433 family)
MPDKGGSMKRANIVRDPEILNGIPTFKGTRVPIRVLIESFESGDSPDEFLENFPSVSKE